MSGSVPPWPPRQAWPLLVPQTQHHELPCMLQPPYLLIGFRTLRAGSTAHGALVVRGRHAQQTPPPSTVAVVHSCRYTTDKRIMTTNTCRAAVHARPFLCHPVPSTHLATPCHAPRATCHVPQTEDTLVHVQWFERTATGRADAPEEDTIVFPGEAVLEKVGGHSNSITTCVSRLQHVCEVAARVQGRNKIRVASIGCIM